MLAEALGDGQKPAVIGRVAFAARRVCLVDDVGRTAQAAAIDDNERRGRPVEHREVILVSLVNHHDRPLVRDEKARAQAWIDAV